LRQALSLATLSPFPNNAGLDYVNF
jgi:hypothetical protein